MLVIVVAAEGKLSDRRIWWLKCKSVEVLQYHLFIFHRSLPMSHLFLLCWNTSEIVVGCVLEFFLLLTPLAFLGVCGTVER